MPNFTLAEGLYVMPSPAGAYYAVSRPEHEPARRLIINLLQHRKSPRLSIRGLQDWAAAKDEQRAAELLHRMQVLGWIQGLKTEQQAPDGTLEDLLPKLLRPLSADGKVLLADQQGFYVSSLGYPHETAEELSALSADLASLHDRHHGLLENNMGLGTSAWAIVDAAGNSQVGFWPLYIGDQRFVLVVGGLPQLNRQALTDLIWALCIRYAKASW